MRLILCDLFGYRGDLTPQQFFQEGYAERHRMISTGQIITSQPPGLGLKATTRAGEEVIALARERIGPKF